MCSVTRPSVGRCVNFGCTVKGHGRDAWCEHLDTTHRKIISRHGDGVSRARGDGRESESRRGPLPAGSQALAGRPGALHGRQRRSKMNTPAQHPACQHPVFNTLSVPILLLVPRLLSVSPQLWGPWTSPGIPAYIESVPAPSPCPSYQLYVCTSSAAQHSNTA